MEAEEFNAGIKAADKFFREDLGGEEDHALQLGGLVYLALRVLGTHGPSCQLGFVTEFLRQIWPSPQRVAIEKSDEVPAEIDPMLIN